MLVHSLAFFLCPLSLPASLPALAMLAEVVTVRWEGVCGRDKKVGEKLEGGSSKKRVGLGEEWQRGEGRGMRRSK